MKRDPVLVPLSHDHHQALVLAKNAKSPSSTPKEDINEVRRRFSVQLEPHFEVEDRVLIPLGTEPPLDEISAKIEEDHRNIRALLGGLSDAASLIAFGEALETHIRYEERTWFPALQKHADLASLQGKLTPRPVSKIRAFRQDENGDWVAELVCEHTQHVRHRPPLESRPWVLQAESRADYIGVALPCPWCRMPRLPTEVEEYKRTPTFGAETVPAGLLRAHSTKGGVWGLIIVEDGRVLYVIENDDVRLMLDDVHPGVIAPEQLHHVEPQPGARFHVRFMK